MPVMKKRGHGWSSVGKKWTSQPVVKNIRVRFICPSLKEFVKNIRVRFICPSLKEKRIKVRSTYEYHPGLRTVLHYPQRVKPCHEPYTCKPRVVRVRSTYTSSSGVQTTLHYPQKFVFKHYVTRHPDEFNQVLPVMHGGSCCVIVKEIGPATFLL